MTSQITPDAVLVDGRIVAAADHADVYLRPGQVAVRQGVTPETVSRWLAAPPGSRYGPDGALPYPAFVDGQHVDVDGVTYVLASALDAWDAAVTAAAPAVRSEASRERAATMPRAGGQFARREGVS